MPVFVSKKYTSNMHKHFSYYGDLPTWKISANLHAYVGGYMLSAQQITPDGHRAPVDVPNNTQGVLSRGICNIPSQHR